MIRLAPILASVLSIAPSAPLPTATASAASVEYRVAGIELYGNTRLSDADLLKGIDLGIGESLPSDSDPVLEAGCATLRNAIGEARFVRVSCTTVRYRGGDLYYVVDVVEPDAKARSSFPSTIYRDHLQLTERDGDRAAAELLACARSCSLSADRADALAFVSEREPSKSLCSAALYALDDAAVEVRSAAARVLNRHLDRCNDLLGIDRIVDASLRQLTRPTHPDRNRALANLDALLKRPANAAALDRPRIEAALAFVAEHSILPNIGGHARELLETLRAPVSAAPAPGPER